MIYTIKPDSGAGKITLTRSGDTATVIDTAKHSKSVSGADTIAFTPSDVPPSAQAELISDGGCISLSLV